jgi:hypothetical protein
MYTMGVVSLVQLAETASKPSTPSHTGVDRMFIVT